MLYEIAVTPGVFDEGELGRGSVSMRDLIRLLEGILQNGLMANLSEGALRGEIGRAVQAIEDITLRDEIRRYVGMIDQRNRLVVRSHQGDGWPVDDGDWYEQALRCHDAEPFHNVITTAASHARNVRPDPIVRLGELLNSNAWNSRSNSRRVRREAESFERTLKPFLENAKSLLFVDPNIKCDAPRYCRPLGALLASAFARSRPEELEVVEVHLKSDTCEERELDRVERVTRDCLGPSVPEGNRVRVVVWQERDVRFHNRYLLSDLGGVSIDAGLDEERAVDEYDDWELLDDDHRNELWYQFTQANRFLYNQLRAFSIP